MQGPCSMVQRDESVRRKLDGPKDWKGLEIISRKCRRDLSLIEVTVFSRVGP